MKEAFMRLDKYLTECGLGSRSDCKKMITKGKITYNGNICKQSKTKVDLENDIVEYNGEKLDYKKDRFYIMNKPAGVITATEDRRHKTVMEVLPDWVIKKDLIPVGRLDKDTEGLLLFTNNGKIAHDMLAPKKHVSKVYYVKLKEEINEEAIKELENGVIIQEDYKTKEAKVEKISSKEINLEIQEGKFHQVKNMLMAVGNEVEYLQRIKFGELELGNLKLSEVREIKGITNEDNN